MSSQPDPALNPEDVVREAIQAGDFQNRGVLFPPFQLKPTPLERSFDMVWNARPFVERGEQYPNVAFFRFRGEDDDFRPLGDVIVAGDGRHDLVLAAGQLLLAPDPSKPDCLRHPVGHEWILNNDGAQGAPFSYWRLIPPPGYTALGICFGFDQPVYEHYWCVKNEYLEPADRTDAWHRDWIWRNNGNLARPIMPSKPPPARERVMWMVPQTVLSEQGQEPARLLKLGVASLPVQEIHSSPVYDPDVTSDDETAPGLKKVAIVPFTGIAADAAYPDQSMVSPFYFVACEPLWRCDSTWSAPEGGSQSITQVAGVSKTDSTSFTEQTSLTVDCNVGLALDALSLGVSASFTQSFSLTTDHSSTSSTEVSKTVTIELPHSDLVAIWSRQVRIALFRLDGSIVSEVQYSTYDQRMLYDKVSGPEPLKVLEPALAE
jgi:hypothetical protein